MKSSKGFSLIELVVVIVILGILSAMAAPRFLNISSDAKKASLDGFVAAYKASEGIIEGKTLLEGKNFESADVIEVGDDEIKVQFGSIIPQTENINKVMAVDGYKIVEFRDAGQTIILPSTYKGEHGSVSLDDYNKAFKTICHVGINQGKEGRLRTILVRNYDRC